MSVVASPPPAVRRSRPAAVPRISRFLLWGFRRHVTRGFGFRGGYVARHFHAVRLAKGSPTAFPADRPLVFFLNHPGWWDPLTAFLLAWRLVPDRRAYAPIERAALDRYPLLDRLGLFGVERSPAGAKAFLETSRAVLSRADASLWLTPQGRFADPSERPVRFEPGLGHLARRTDAVFVPVAVDYRFWDERLPEALVRVGMPIDGDDVEGSASTGRFERALESTMDALADDAASRDAHRFETILSGGAGVGPLYDFGRRIKAFAVGRHYDAHHGGPAAEETRP